MEGWEMNSQKVKLTNSEGSKDGPCSLSRHPLEVIPGFFDRLEAVESKLDTLKAVDQELLVECHLRYGKIILPINSPSSTVKGEWGSDLDFEEWLFRESSMSQD